MKRKIQKKKKKLKRKKRKIQKNVLRCFTTGCRCLLRKPLNRIFLLFPCQVKVHWMRNWLATAFLFEIVVWNMFSV